MGSATERPDPTDAGALALQQIADLLREHKGDACTWVQQIRCGPLMCVTHNVEIF